MPIARKKREYVVFPLSILARAYSIAVERFHGMEQVGVRLPVGPQIKITDRGRSFLFYESPRILY